MKDWIHISHIASCGAGGVRFSLLLSPSPLHSLCKCNRGITQDKALQSRDMKPPFWGIQTYLTWCNQRSEPCWVVYLSHWLLGNWMPWGALSRCSGSKKFFPVTPQLSRWWTQGSVPIFILITFLSSSCDIKQQNWWWAEGLKSSGMFRKHRSDSSLIGKP